MCPLSTRLGFFPRLFQQGRLEIGFDWLCFLRLRQPALPCGSLVPYGWGIRPGGSLIPKGWGWFALLVGILLLNSTHYFVSLKLFHHLDHAS